MCKLATHMKGGGEKINLLQDFIAGCSALEHVCPNSLFSIIRRATKACVHRCLFIRNEDIWFSLRYVFVALYVGLQLGNPFTLVIRCKIVAW